MPTYAGIALAQPTPELIAWVESYVPTRDIVQFNPVPYLDHLQNVMPYPDQSDDPVQIGSLWWPQGASRWAVGYYIVTESQRNAINAIVNNRSTYNPANLVLDDATSSITASMWMLPPRPLAQNPPDADSLTKWIMPKADSGSSGEPVYLLTLVDDRYFWWQRAGDITLEPPKTSWANLISQIGTILGVTITTDTINPVYLKPPASLIQYQNFLPLLLDLCAFSVGLRVIRLLNGNVILQSATNALASMNAQLAANPQRMAGGIYAFDLV